MRRLLSLCQTAAYGALAVALGVRVLGPFWFDFCADPAAPAVTSVAEAASFLTGPAGYSGAELEAWLEARQRPGLSLFLCSLGAVGFGFTGQQQLGAYALLLTQLGVSLAHGAAITGAWLCAGGGVALAAQLAAKFGASAGAPSATAAAVGAPLGLGGKLLGVFVTLILVRITVPRFKIESLSRLSGSTLLCIWLVIILILIFGGFLG